MSTATETTIDGRWNAVELEGRGVTFACEHPGPPGAPTVVLLHGWTASGASNWVGTCEMLAEHYRVLALDHRGHGRGMRARFTLEDCADDVIALLDASGVPRATLIGYSMGGPIAQLAWQRHPDRVEGLVLYATAARFSTRGVSVPVLRAAGPMMSLTFTMARPMLLGALRPAAAIAVDDETAEPYGGWLDAFAQHDIHSILHAAEEILRYDARPWIGIVDVPTAVVVTSRDRVVPPERQRELAAAVPGAHIIERNGSHRLPFSDPGASATAVLAGCRLVTPAGPRSRWRRGLGGAWGRWRARRRARRHVSRSPSLPSRR